MRIGIITYDFYPPIGGQGVESYNLYKRLKDKMEVFILSSRKNDLKNHIHVHIPTGDRIGTLFFSLYINLNLDRIVKKYKPDLLQAYGGPGGVLLLRKSPIPLIYVANHTYAQQFKHLKRPIYTFLMRLEKKGYNLSKKIIAISSTTKDSLVKDYGISPRKIEVIPVGIDTNVFRPLKIKKIPNSMLYVGRLHERKGLPYLIKAIKTVRKEIPNLKLYIIGDGNLRSPLQENIKGENLSDNIIFLGKVSEEELIKWYNKVEVFVLPSLFEGFGIVCVEAMACGIPVIGTRVPGIVDIIKNRKNGILIPSKNSKKLANAIIGLLKDEKLRQLLGENGKKEVIERFDWDMISQEFINVYKGMLK